MGGIKCFGSNPKQTRHLQSPLCCCETAPIHAGGLGKQFGHPLVIHITAVLLHGVERIFRTSLVHHQSAEKTEGGFRTALEIQVGMLSFVRNGFGEFVICRCWRVVFRVYGVQKHFASQAFKGAPFSLQHHCVQHCVQMAGYLLGVGFHFLRFAGPEAGEGIAPPIADDDYHTNQDLHFKKQYLLIFDNSLNRSLEIALQVAFVIIKILYVPLFDCNSPR